MSKSSRAIRSVVVRFAFVLVAAAALTVTAAGTNAAAFSFLDDVKEFFGVALVEPNYLDTQSREMDAVQDVTPDMLANTCTSVATGTWASASTWTNCGGTFPIAGDTAIIDGGFTVTLGAAAAAANVTVNANNTLDASTFALTVSSTFTLAANSTFKQGGSVSATPGSTRAFDTNSTYIFNGTQSAITGGAFTFGNLTWNSSGNATPAVSLTINGSLSILSSQLRGSTTTNSRSHTVLGNAVIDGATSILVGSNNSAAGLTGTWNISGNVTTQNGGTLRGTLSVGDGVFNVGGNLINNGTVEHGAGAGIFTVNFNGTAAQSIGGVSTANFGNFTDSNTSAAVTFNTNFNVSGTLTMNGAGTLFTPGSPTVQINSAGNTGTITGTGRVQVTSLSANPFSSQYRFFTFSVTTLTVEWAGAGDQTIENGVAGYGGIMTSGSGTKTIGGSGTLAISGSVATGAGTTLAQGSNTLNIGGNWNNGGAFTPGISPVGVTLNGAGAQTVTTGGSGAGKTFGIFTINKSGGTATLAGPLRASTLNVTAGTLDTSAASSFAVISNGDLNINGGIFTANASTVTVGGNWSNTGTFTAGTSGVVFNGATGQTVSGNTSFYNFNKTTASAQQLNFTAGSATTVTNSLTFNGTLGNLLSLRSTTSGTQWGLVAPATQSVNYVDVQDSNANGGSAVVSTNSVNSGNNLNWNFPVPPPVSLSVNTHLGTEATATAVTVMATASSAVTGDQTVSLGVSGTGVTGGDHTLSSGTITILNGATTGTATFTVVNDVDFEGTETAILTISGPSAGITLGSPTVQTITIADNDFSGTPCGAAAWAAISGFPEPIYGPAGVSDGTYYYSVGGYSYNVGPLRPVLYRYDPAVPNTWTTLATLPTAVNNATAVYSPAAHKIYVFGGHTAFGDGGTTNVTQIYDISSDTWSTGANMPAVRAMMSAGYSNGMIYLAGGFAGATNSAPQADVYEYDPIANSFAAKASMPAPAAAASFGVINGHLYVAGGAVSPGTQTSDYNIGTDTWTTVAAMPGGSFKTASAVTQGKLWMFGGGVGQKYDPVTNTWTNIPVVSQEWLGGAAVGDKIIGAGGYNGVNPIANAEILDVTCLLSPTAAWVSLGGRVTTAEGNGITNAKVLLSGGSIIGMQTTLSSSFGYYRFDGLEAGATYVVTIGAKRFRFADPSRVVTLSDSIVDFDFMANPQE